MSENHAQRQQPAAPARKTRKEWAAAFGVDYQIMAVALRGMGRSKGKRMPGLIFDEDTARDALVKYYADRRMRYLMKAQQLEQRINEVREMVIT